MRFTLVSAHKKILDVASVDSVSLPAAGGTMEVLPGHEPFFAAVKPGVLKVRAAGKETTYAVGEGLLETDGKSVTMLADTIESPDDLSQADVAARRAAAQKLVAELAASGTQDPDTLVEAEMALLRETARAQVSAH